MDISHRFTNTQDTTNTTETGIKKNKQAWTWVSSKRKKGEVLAVFYGFLRICGYRKHVSKRNSHTATGNTDSSSCIGWPGFWVHRSQLLTQQLPFFDGCLSLTVVNFFLLLTALGPCLSSSSSSLVGNLTHPLCEFRAKNRQRNLLTGTHPHPQKWIPPHHATMASLDRTCFQLPDSIFISCYYHWLHIVSP